MTIHLPPYTEHASPQSRRIIAAIVTGELGERIQHWRERHDPKQARRLPPHATLCYWADVNPSPELEAQIVHAFAQPVSVRLGPMRQFSNDEGTYYLTVHAHNDLDAARDRLYDGRHLAMPSHGPGTWHITCVRDSRGRDLAELRRATFELSFEETWWIDRIDLLELHGTQYEPIATYHV